MTDQITCKNHYQVSSLICLNCYEMLCPECISEHRQRHTEDQKIMNFQDVLSFCIQAQQFYGDSLESQILQVNQNNLMQESQRRKKCLKELKQQLRNVVREYIDKLLDDFNKIKTQQEKEYQDNCSKLSSNLDQEIKRTNNILSIMKNDGSIKSLSQSKINTKSKFSLTTSQIQKPQEEEFEEDDNESLSPKRQRPSNLLITQEVMDSVIVTIKNQENMKKKIDDLKQEYLKLSKDLEQEIIIIDDEIEENLKDFLESQIYIKGTEKKISNHYQKQKPPPSAEKTDINTRSVSPFTIKEENAKGIVENTISSLGISLAQDQQIKGIQAPQQLKQWEHKPLTLQDLDVNTHDYFMSKPFLHFFNIKDNQIVIQYIGSNCTTIFYQILLADQAQNNKNADQIPNRARFQSTYLADPKSLALQQSKNNMSSEIFRNIFKGGIEKKTLNSTFAIPTDHRTIALPNREIYVVGGQYESETVPFVFKYNWESNSLVEAGKPLIMSRSNFGIAQLNNYIYVVGGYNEKFGTLKSCEVMDVITKQWSPIADLNKECRHLTLCSFSNRLLYKFGGIGGDDQLNEYIEKFEPNTNRWISFHIQNRNTLKSRFQLYSLSGAVQINQNHLMVFGGSDAGLSEDTDQTFLCEIGNDFCKIVGLNKVTISTKGAIVTNAIVNGNRIYAMQLQRDKKGHFHPYRRNMMLYEEKQWKVNN